MCCGVAVSRVDRLESIFPSARSVHRSQLGCLLLAQEVAEESDGVAGVADCEALCLGAVVLVAVDVGQHCRDLSICQATIKSAIYQSAQRTEPSIPCFFFFFFFYSPPSSLAMTSALSSTVYAIELLELPNVMPITTRSPGSTTGWEFPLSAILCV